MISNSTDKEPQSKYSLVDIVKGNLMSTRREEKNLVLIGSKASGKTTVFNSLTNIQTPKDTYVPTAGINYGFMRYQQSSARKQLLNVYEIGGGMENLSLLSSIIANENIAETIIVIVLDFEKPKGALNSLLKYLEALNAILKEKISAEMLSDCAKTKEGKYISKERLKDIKVFPANVLVLGNKYNLLEKIEIESLRWVCKVFRYFCCVNSLSLMYYIFTDSKLNTLLQSTVTDFAFGQSKIDNISVYTQKNELKALYIHYGRDTLIEIGDPKVMQMSGADMTTLWIETYQTLFRKDDNDKDDKAENDKRLSESIKEMYDKYKEPRIDNEKNIFDSIKEGKVKGKQADAGKALTASEKRPKKKAQMK